MNKSYDIVIVGGGLVGACLALALQRSRYSVCVLEYGQPKAQAQPNPIDDRAIVLSKASQNILSALNLWDDIAHFASAVRHIHVSNKGHFGTVRLDARDYDVDALGWVALAQNLYQVLQGALDHIDVVYDAQFLKMTQQDTYAVVEYEKDIIHSVNAKLVVAADGSFSTVREQQHISTTIHDYQQSAILCNVGLQDDHQHVAYERFTPEGPCALLPMAEKTCAVVWALPPDKAKKLVELPVQDFLSELQKHFGYRLGKFTAVNKPFVVPLSLMRADQLVKDRLVLIGNASQTLHPIAGQGLNLGLRDMAALAELLLECNGDPGSAQLAKEYVEWRRFDQRHMISLTHSLVALFSNDFYPLVAGRSIGLMVMERVPQLRELFAQSSMGMMGRLPKLVCGVRNDA